MNWNRGISFLNDCCTCSRLFFHSYTRSRSRARSVYGILGVGKSSSVINSMSHNCIFLQTKTNRILSLSANRMFSTEHESQSENQTLPKKKSLGHSKKSPISWKTLLVVAGLGGAFAIGMHVVKKEKEEEMKKKRSKQMGKALLGGDWTLTDHHGKRRSSKEFHGQWILIYFGFTNCPDICPEEIEKIVRVINDTDKDRDLPTIQPIVITVDPERDTPEALKEYCGEFSPRLLGFTGTIEEITAATRAYRVYFSAGPKDEDNDYIVDHSIISYLVNPEGEFVDYFGQNKTSKEIYNSIKLHISTYNQAQKKKQ